MAEQSDGTARLNTTDVADAALRGRPMPEGYSLIHTATILREGWEMDNKLCVIDGPSGRVLAGTDHGRVCVPLNEDLDYLIAEHEKALADLRKAKSLMEAVRSSPL